MKLYVLEHPSDPTKFKVERRSSNNGTICEFPEPLLGKAWKLVDGEPVLDEIAEQQRLDAVAAKAIVDAEEAELTQMQTRFNAAQRIKAKIALINKSKNMSSSEILSYLSDPAIQAISNLLSEISFGTALVLLDSSDLSAYYTQEEVDEVKSMIQAHLDSEA